MNKKNKVEWDQVFKKGPSKICGRQLLKNLEWYGLLKQVKFVTPVDPRKMEMY